jgi:hypothetical protein
MRGVLGKMLVDGKRVATIVTGRAHLRKRKRLVIALDK